MPHRIERTTPAFVRLLPNSDFTAVRANKFTVGMYLPKEYQVLGWDCLISAA